jgi:uncharacterized membrane protein
MHIPTILAGILEGPYVGGMVGFIFGLFSFWRAQSGTNPVARVLFTDPLVAFLPRILIGVVAYYAYALATGDTSRRVAALGVGGILGYTIYSALGHVNTLHNAAVSAGASQPVLVRALSGLTIYPAFSTGLGLISGAFAAYAVHRALKEKRSGPVLGALFGTLANTGGVLGLAVLRGYMTPTIAWGVALIQGVPEMLVAIILTVLIHRGVSRATFRRQSATPAIPRASKPE